MPELTYREAAHLFRRMGFNAPPEEITALVGANRDKAVNRLLNYQAVDNTALEAALRNDFNFLSVKNADGLKEVGRAENFEGLLPWVGEQFACVVEHSQFPEGILLQAKREHFAGRNGNVVWSRQLLANMRVL